MLQKVYASLKHVEDELRRVSIGGGGGGGSFVLRIASI